MKTNELKKKLKQGIPCMGPFLRLNSLAAEIIAIAGWDFGVIDIEHGVHSISDIVPLKNAAAAFGMSTVVRVPGPSPIDIMRSLDAGSEGVQVPQITTLQQVKDSCAAARFAPLGNRGSCSYTTGAQYSLTPYPEHRVTSNEQVLTVIQVETVEAANMIEEIVEIPGIDVVFCGPWDLSQSMGLPGQSTDPRVKDVIKKVARVVTDKGINCGMHIEVVEQVPEWLDAGMTYFTCGTDAGMLARYAKNAADENKKTIEKWMKLKDR